MGTRYATHDEPTAPTCAREGAYHDQDTVGVYQQRARDAGPQAVRPRGPGRADTVDAGGLPRAGVAGRRDDAGGPAPVVDADGLRSPRTRPRRHVPRQAAVEVVAEDRQAAPAVTSAPLAGAYFGATRPRPARRRRSQLPPMTFVMSSAPYPRALRASAMLKNLSGVSMPSGWTSGSG